MNLKYYVHIISIHNQHVYIQTRTATERMQYCRPAVMPLDQDSIVSRLKSYLTQLTGHATSWTDSSPATKRARLGERTRRSSCSKRDPRSRHILRPTSSPWFLRHEEVACTCAHRVAGPQPRFARRETARSGSRCSSMSAGRSPGRAHGPPRLSTTLEIAARPISTGCAGENETRTGHALQSFAPPLSRQCGAFCGGPRCGSASRARDQTRPWIGGRIGSRPGPEALNNRSRGRCRSGIEQTTENRLRRSSRNHQAAGALGEPYKRSSWE